MACVILLSSTGFGLVEHTCQMRGKKKTMVVVFSDAKSQSGCAIHKQSGQSSSRTIIKKSECCQDDQRYENVDVTSSLSQLVAKFVKNITESILAGVTVMLAWIADWVFDRSASVAVNVTNEPPSPSGRDILTRAHSLLI
jgi:hypothetical protein